MELDPTYIKRLGEGEKLKDIVSSIPPEKFFEEAKKIFLCLVLNKDCKAMSEMAAMLSEEQKQEIIWCKTSNLI